MIDDMRSRRWDKQAETILVQESSGATTPHKVADVS